MKNGSQACVFTLPVVFFWGARNDSVLLQHEVVLMEV